MQIKEVSSQSNGVAWATGAGETIYLIQMKTLCLCQHYRIKNPSEMLKE